MSTADLDVAAIEALRLPSQTRISNFDVVLSSEDHAISRALPVFQYVRRGPSDRQHHQSGGHQQLA